MSLFTTLAKEHDLFRQLILKLERCLKGGEEYIHRELQEVLLVLLPALARHEEIEDAIFAHPHYRSRKGARRMVSLMGDQHRDIDSLRRELLELLRAGGRYDVQKLKPIVFTLAERLRLHFYSEETRLWPYYKRVTAPTLDHSLDHRARRQVVQLERDIDKNWLSVSKYASN